MTKRLFSHQHFDNSYTVWDYPKPPFITMFQFHPYKCLFITSLEDLENMMFGC